MIGATMQANAYEKNLNPSISETERPTLSIGGLLKLAKLSCETEVEQARQQARFNLDGSSIRHQRRSISQLEVQQIIDDQVQWEKLKQTIRDRNATTGMKLKQELQSLLQDRLTEISKEKTIETPKKMFGFVPSLQQRVTRRISIALEHETQSRRSAFLESEVVAKVAPLGGVIKISSDSSERLSLNRSELIDLLDTATNLSTELDEPTHYDPPRPRNQVMPRMA
jgi:hypothetical protein